MTKLIDGDRLEAFLATQPDLDSVLIRLVLDDFVYLPPKTPLSQIEIPVKEIVRRNDKSTSWFAAISISSENRVRLYEAIRLALWDGRRTDDELRENLLVRGVAHSPSGLRTRRSELVKSGWVRDSGERRDSDLGHPAIVWELAPEVRNV